MNLLYIAFKDFSNLHFGANKKVLNECKAFENMGHTVTLIGRYGSDIVRLNSDGSFETIRKFVPKSHEVLNKLSDKAHQLTEIRRYIENKSFDLCYIRYDLSTRDFVNTVRALNSVCKKIIIEIPTYPYKKEYEHARFSKLRMWLDDHYARKLKPYTDSVVSFYEVEPSGFYGIPVIKVPNGFDFSEIKLISDPTVPESIHIAAVSSMREWHGYERFIEGLHEYYTANGKRNIVLHLVGNGPEYAKYKALVEKYSLGENVILHGALHGESLEKLLESCTLGIDSLARHRSGISILSSLKSREYGAKGIPLINSCKIDIIEDDYPYCLYVSADETPIKMQDVIEYHDRVYCEGDRVKVAERIREYIESRSDMNSVMRQILTATCNEE